MTAEEAEGRLFPIALDDLRAERELSPGARRTKRQRDALARGRHPATGHALREGEETCGSCINHKIIRASKTWHKCELHPLGLSASEASDIRVGWPACTLWKPAP